MNKINVRWSQDRYGFLFNAIKVYSNKTEFNGLRYIFNAVLTVGDDGLATDCKLTNRSYDLGTWYKRDGSNRADLDFRKNIEPIGFHPTPSKVQSKLKSCGINDVIVSSLEGSLAMRCIETYNDGVRWEREHKLQLDFESRCNDFIADFNKLKEKYSLKVKMDTYVGDFDSAEVQIILEDTSNLSNHVHEKYVTNELGFED